MKTMLEGSTKSRFVLYAVYALVAIAALVLLICYNQSTAGTKDTFSTSAGTAGITAIASEYQTQEVTIDPNAVALVAVANPQDEAAFLGEESDNGGYSTETVAVFPVTLEMFDPNTPLEERPYIRELAGLVEAEIGQVVEENAKGITFDNREEEIEAYKEGVAVVLSVFNRCAYDKNYPDGIDDNIYKRNQFADPKYPYTQYSLRAVELAIELWNEGRAAEILPPEYESFFGWGKHNYYYDYDNNYAIFEGLIDLPSDIKQKQRQIIPELH